MQLRRRWLKVLAAAGVFGPAGIAGVVSQALAMGKAPVAPGIHTLRGDVTVNGKPARPGQLIGPGDTVVTGADSQTIYVVGQDAFLQRDKTTLVFGTDAVKSFFRVVTGRVLSVFGKSQDQRILQASTASIGIRGTGCYIEDEGRGATARTYFCLCYGSVELTPMAAPQERESYSTSHHDHPLYIYNDMKMPKMMVPAGVINHTDDELTMLEGLVGRWPPFMGKSFGRNGGGGGY
ncbi:MAG: hypothetical protein PHH58_06920 [Rhodoferax sp.]|nr:hypothetical protein [Rhodoferax sp.]